LFSACAKKPAYKHIPPKKQSVRIEHERAPETGAKKEIIRVESAPSPVMATPQARASARLIDGGRQKMTAGQFDQAERSFQEAINIDPSNGIAYYYLARARFELGQGPQALGVLDKAEELLSGSAEWSEAVQTLKGLIRESVSN
jgi:tetratricopeptide (TPR) repeat protein